MYGLAADAENAGAVRRIFALKGRPASHPLIVHVAGSEAAGHFARQVPDLAQRLMAAFWPGPLTLILARREGVADKAAGGHASIDCSIIQTYKIAMEIKKITGKNPKKVFIEMAKGGGEKGKRTERRKDKIKELYKNMKDSLSDYCNNLQDLSSQVEKYDDNRLR